MLQLITLLVFLIYAFPSEGFSATTSMRVLYPSFAGTWAVAWVAKEAGYFAAEGLDVENQFKDKTPLPKPESFVDTSLVDQLERSGFIDSVYK
jgi:ABC-type nitrate/sulfonate/bicarbonate transport system substrate-binding protein